MDPLAPEDAAVEADGIGRALDRLAAAQEKLRRRPASDVLLRLDEVVGLWLAERSPWLAQAVEVLTARTGLAPEMLRAGLARMIAPLGGEAIGRLLDEELGVRGWRAGGPALVAHVLPGNVPALAACAISLSLAVGAAALIKPAREERWFAPLFAASLRAVDEDLAACVAVRYWRGGGGPVEDEVFARADAVDVSGGDDAVAAVRGRVRGRFVGRGARLSFAALGRETIADDEALGRSAEALAEDVAIWEQRGCLSPQVVFAETSSPAALGEVARRLAAALDERARRWPPPPLSLDEKAALLRFRQAAEWGLGEEPGARLLAGDNGSSTILIERASALRPTCLHRTVRLQPIADLAVLPVVIEPMRRQLEAAGLAVAPPRFAALARSLGAAGVHRVCAVGEMQSPDLGWKPGGLPRVASWFA